MWVRGESGRVGLAERLGWLVGVQQKIKPTASSHALFQDGRPVGPQARQEWRGRARIGRGSDTG
jgi:hypothetical protein